MLKAEADDSIRRFLEFDDKALFYEIAGMEALAREINADEGVSITNDSLLDQGQRLRRLTDAALAFTLLDQVEGLT